MIIPFEKHNTGALPKVFYFCIFILFVNSMGLWIGWCGREKIIRAISIGLMLFSIIHYNIKFSLNKKNIVSVLVVCVCSVFFFGEMSILGFSNFFLFFIFCCLDIYNQKQCLKYIFKWFAWMMVPSIIVYVFVQFGTMPSFGSIAITDDVNVNTGFEYINRTNYLFYCWSSVYNIRFNGPFVEPGHLGMITAFLLFADGFQFKKKETWILILTILMTLSLSGYFLLVAAYLFMKIEKQQVNISLVVFIFSVLILIYSIGKFYNGGDNFLNDMILSRLEYDEERGFSGNNRVTAMVYIYYDAMFNDIGTLLYGYKKDVVDYMLMNKEGGTGFLMSMVAHGLIGTIAGILFYFVYYLFSEHKRTAFLFFTFVIMLYWQRTYPFWYSWIICFVFGITNRINEGGFVRNNYK